MPAAFSGCTVERLNASRMRHPALPPEASTAAVDELTRDRSAMSLEAANREVYRLLKEGIPVSVLERDSTSGRAELPLTGVQLYLVELKCLLPFTYVGTGRIARAAAGKYLCGRRLLKYVHAANLQNLVHAFFNPVLLS